MEDSDSNDAGNENAAGAGADHSTSPTSSDDTETASNSMSTRPSAIERQMAAVSQLGYGHQTRQETLERAIGRRKAYFYAKHRRPRRFVLASLLVLFLLVAAGVALMFTQPGRPLQNAVGSVFQPQQQTIPTHNAPPATAPPTAVPEKVPEVATPSAISVPIADVSLRNRPELLEQLVQVYKSQLADNPNDATALAALTRLQERSLSELETIVVAGDDPTSVRSLELASRLFPELIDNPRYKYLIARMDHIRHEANTEPPAEPEHSTPSATAISPQPIAPMGNVSAPSAVPAEIANKPAVNALPPKPQIHVVSITPGSLLEQRFVPSDEGTAFMVEISYRNFKIFEDQSEAALVALLGIPGDPTVLAEVPIDISGDRGTKSFLMETLIPVNTGEKYRLNFVLNGKFLASSTVRLSRPKQ